MRMICVNNEGSNGLLKKGVIYNTIIVSKSSFDGGFGIEIEELKKVHYGIPFFLWRFKPYIPNLSPNIKIL